MSRSESPANVTLIEAGAKCSAPHCDLHDYLPYKVSLQSLQAQLLPATHPDLCLFIVVPILQPILLLRPLQTCIGPPMRQICRYRPNSTSLPLLPNPDIYQARTRTLTPPWRPISPLRAKFYSEKMLQKGVGHHAVTAPGVERYFMTRSLVRYVSLPKYCLRHVSNILCFDSHAANNFVPLIATLQAIPVPLFHLLPQRRLRRPQPRRHHHNLVLNSPNDSVRA